MNSEIKSQAIKNIIDNARPFSSRNKRSMSYLKPFMSKNNTDIYKDTPEDKEKIFQELYSKISNIKNVEDKLYKTNKHLIYFTIFLSEDYIRLLDLCLKSIFKHTKNINFDILFITDETFKQKIMALDVCKNFICHFHVVDPCLTGVTASTKKLNIFDFSLIKNYEKILYLDCDIICIKDIIHIFNKPIFSEVLYVATNKTMKSSGLSSPHHSLMHLTQKDAEYIYENTHIALPFNAGQFLFLNSDRMKLHFDNVRWLLSVWPGWFFFEQSFMNHYFVLNGFTQPLEDETLNQLVSLSYEKPKFVVNNAVYDENGINVAYYRKKMKVYGAVSSSYSADKVSLPADSGSFLYVDNDSNEKIMEMKHTQKHVILHFANLTLSGEKKIKYIEEYINAYKL